MKTFTCYEFISWFLIGVLILAGVLSKSVSHDDNLVEEVAEQVMEAKLGLPPGSIDLSPESDDPDRRKK